MQYSAAPTSSPEKSQRACDMRLPCIVIEKQTRLLNYANSTGAALTRQLENCVGLLKGHSATLHYCNEVIEGALLTLGVSTTHSLLSSINGVIEGLETVAETCKVMCDSHFEEVRQREDVFGSLSNMYVALAERHESTERELRAIVAERDLQNAAFNKVVSYVEAVIAERAVWQERNGYNCVGLPMVDRSFSEMCHEALDTFDSIASQLRCRDEANGGRLVSCADTPGELVRRWEALEDLRYKNGTPSARLQYIPPRDEVLLLREVLEMGTVGRVLMRDVREERTRLEEAKKKVSQLGVTSLGTLRVAREELKGFKEWLLGLKRRGHPFNTSFESLRGKLTQVEKVVVQNSMDKEMFLSTLRHDVWFTEGIMDRYQLDRYPFSRTPTSALYRCTDLITGERLAVKVVDRRTTSGERRVQRLLHGVQMVSRAGSHEGIVSVRGVYELGKKAFLVMEYVSGGSLYNYIKRRGPLGEAAAVVVVKQLLEALARLHGVGIMHRDVKVENVLIRSPTDCKGPPSGVCICDFGFLTNKAHNNGFVGSPQYCAPEVALIGIAQGKSSMNDYSYDEKCDIWSLGVVTYVILSGLLPFDGSTVNEVFMSILRHNVSFSHVAWRDVSEAAKNFVLSLMTPDPEKRPSARRALGHPWLV